MQINNSISNSIQSSQKFTNLFMSKTAMTKRSFNTVKQQPLQQKLSNQTSKPSENFQRHLSFTNSDGMSENAAGYNAYFIKNNLSAL